MISMPNRNGLSFFLLIVAVVCLGWAIRGSAAAGAQPAPPAHCSQALANKNGMPAAKRRAAEPHCTSALQHRAA
jgi:hypothetical protein